MKIRFIILFLLLVQVSLAQVTSIDSLNQKEDSEAVIKIDKSKVKKHSFNEKALENYKDSGDFVFEIPQEEPSFITRAWLWLKYKVKELIKSIFDDAEPVIGLLGSILSIIPWALLAIAIFLLVKYFLKVGPRQVLKGKNAQLVDYTDDEALIHLDNLEELLNEALAKKDYRLAVRFQYLMILQKLSKQKAILWKQEKTNEDYIRELKGKSYQQLFVDSTRLYDFVWYGNFEINQKEFDKSSQLFSHLMTLKID